MLILRSSPNWAGMARRWLHTGMLVLSLCAFEAAADDLAPAATSHGLRAQLESFMRQQGIEAQSIEAQSMSADAMVRLMIDWYRFAQVRTAADSDDLVFRYGGWSEGCATAFKFSLLRRVAARDAATPERLAGITLMFEPSAQAELRPFAAVSSDSQSIEAFAAVIAGSPAFRILASATPMAVLVESGTVR